MSPNDLLIQVIKVVEGYLGPPTERFVGRQILLHLGKVPEDITKDDLPELAEWIKVSMGAVTEDKKMLDNCAAEILKLAS